jgi:hypothetical protein
MCAVISGQLPFGLYLRADQCHSRVLLRKSLYSLALFVGESGGRSDGEEEGDG